MPFEIFGVIRYICEQTRWAVPCRFFLGKYMQDLPEVSISIHYEPCAERAQDNGQDLHGILC